MVCSSEDNGEYRSCSWALGCGPWPSRAGVRRFFLIYLYIRRRIFRLFVRLRNVVQYCAIVVLPGTQRVRSRPRSLLWRLNCKGRWSGIHESSGHSGTRDKSLRRLGAPPSPSTVIVTRVRIYYLFIVYCVFIACRIILYFYIVIYYYIVVSCICAKCADCIWPTPPPQWVFSLA